jgi:hypothetical protein
MAGLSGAMCTSSPIHGGRPSRMFGDGSPTTPMRRSPSRSKFHDASTYVGVNQDELISILSANLSSKLVESEARVVDRVDHCYKQHLAQGELQNLDFEDVLARVESRIVARQQADIAPLLSSFADRIIACMDAYFQSQVKQQEDARTDLIANVECNIVSNISSCLQPLQDVLQEESAKVSKTLSEEVTPRLQHLEEALGKQSSRQPANSADWEGRLGQAERLVKVTMPSDASSPVSSKSPATVSSKSQSKRIASLQRPLLQEEKDVEAQMSTIGSVWAPRLPDYLRRISRRSSSHRMESLFPKIEDIKGRVKESLQKNKYDVERLYKGRGMCQAIARNELFKGTILIVILMNMFWVAIDTDYNKATVLCNALPIFQIGDNAFLLVFLFEILVRFFAFENKLNAFMDSWFVFDTILVSLMVWETWIMVTIYLWFGYVSGSAEIGNYQVLRILRMVRLARVARSTRLLHTVPELWVLAQGVIVGLRSVLAVLCLLLLIVYVFGVLFTLCLADTELAVGKFETVPMGINFLLLEVLCGPDKAFIQKLLTLHVAYYLMYLSFLLIAVLLLMNMLIGILCTVVSDVAYTQKEEKFMLEVEYQTARLAKSLDHDRSGGISKEEFDIIIKDPFITASFDEIGVDIVAVANFARFIFEWCDEISYTDFGMLVAQFRTNKQSTVKDIMAIREYVTMELLEMEAQICQVREENRVPLESTP